MSIIERSNYRQFRIDFLFYLGFLSRTFVTYRTVGERGDYIFNSSVPLSPASHTLGH